MTSACPLQILDLDLDFFVEGVAHDRRPDSPRVDDADFPPWSREDVLSFLTDRCLLSGPLPGLAVEHHRDLFRHWRTGVQSGHLTAPFHVTHVDAHADLGLGELSYQYLMTELLFEKPEERLWPKKGPEGLDDGSFLAFAIACRWVSELRYVYNWGGGEDVFGFFKEGFDPAADFIQLAAMSKVEMEKIAGLRGLSRREEAVPSRLEPRVPFEEVPWHAFQSDESFDFIFLTRSPAFTPPAADALFETIRQRFIDESAGQLLFGGATDRHYQASP